MKKIIAVLNGKKFRPIHLCWLFRRLGLPIPPFVGAGSAFTVSGSRIANATRTWQAAEDTPVTNWNKANDFIVAIAFESSAHASAAGNLRIYWRNKTDGGSFTSLYTYGEITYFGETDLVNDNAVVTGEKGCTSLLTTFVDGVEREGENEYYKGLGNDEWTECHWAVDASNALPGKEYEFELYDRTEGAHVGVCLATLTIKAAAPAYIPRHSGSCGVLIF